MRDVSQLIPRYSRLDVHITPGDTIGLLGMRGTGKTTLGKRIYSTLRAMLPNHAGYVIDSNAAGDFAGWDGYWPGANPPVVRDGEQLVWQPGHSNRHYEGFFSRLFDYGRPAILLMDEVRALGKGNHDMWEQLFTRGRTRGITVIAHSQTFSQESDVPRATFSQVQHLFKFYVQHVYDNRASNALLHLPSDFEITEPHGVVYARLEPPVRPMYLPDSRSVQLWLN